MYSNDIRYLPGRDNEVADLLSRPEGVPLGSNYSMDLLDEEETMPADVDVLPRNGAEISLISRNGAGFSPQENGVSPQSWDANGANFQMQQLDANGANIQSQQLDLDPPPWVSALLPLQPPLSL